ncbi:MAG: hypothetical protein JEZ07_05660 [Phycisphaerae bacterium]|nr:hypothetical protein [Phycisphaerae bacterium]
MLFYPQTNKTPDKNSSQPASHQGKNQPPAIYLKLKPDISPPNQHPNDPNQRKTDPKQNISGLKQDIPHLHGHPADSGTIILPAAALCWHHHDYAGSITILL